MPWKWRLRRRHRPDGNGRRQAMRERQRLAAQQPHVDRMVRDLQDSADAFTDAMTRALGGST